MNQLIKKLKQFDWKLFIALCLLSLVPAIIQTIETAIISTNVSTTDIDVIGQIEWFDLINETICAFLIIPLYSVLSKILNKNKEEFSSYVFKTGLITFLLYSLFSIFVLIYAANLIKFMNPNEINLSLVNSYLSITTIAFMIGIIVSFINVVFVVIGKSINIYIFLAVKSVLTIVCDFLIIPHFGVIGVAIGNIVINLMLAIVGIIILIKGHTLKVSKFSKLDFIVFKDWAKVGVFSGVQQFIANIVYALMICKMVNMVAEQGNYWIANNFIWGWMLIPIFAITEVIRKDCKDGYNNLKQTNYYLIITFVIILWCITIPLWTPFFKYVEKLENYKQVFNIVIMLFPFYICYGFQQIPDNIFIGLGKTKYNFISTCIINFIYYGIWYILFKTNNIIFTMNTIILMFGFGMTSSLVVSLIEEKVFLKKELKKYEN